MMKYILSLIVIISFASKAYCQTSRLFDSDEIIDLTLRGDLKTVFKDNGDDPQYHPAYVQYQSEEGSIDIPLKIKTRGHFRKNLGNCQYPPIQLNFAKASTPKTSIFWGQDKMKLVTPCSGDRYVINEYLVYKIYNLITPKSFKARLVRVIYEDTVKNKSSDPYYGVLLEEEDQMAERNLSIAIKTEGLRPKRMEKDAFLKMAVFEYLIGNTDWSIQYLQNIKLIAKDSASIPTAVPYDFDHAGIVRAPYARPAPALKLASTLERNYRGYCIQNMEEFQSTFESFNQLKNEIYSLYTDNQLLSNGYIKQTIKFLDQFYETINDPKKAERAFTYPCDKSGTGNVIIQGIKDQP